MATIDSTKARALLAVGTAAPDFTLHSTPDQKVSLSDFKGQPVVLVFYPADWSPVCGDQVALYNEMLDQFAESDAQVLGISVDGVWCHLAFAKDRSLHFPLLADFEPKGEVSKKFGAYHDDLGESSRALFVLDAAGVIRWNHLSDGVNPGAAGILKALESLTAEQRGSASARAKVMTGEREGATLSIPVSASDHAEGPANAKVTLVEYGDYQCPYCGSAYEIVKEVQKEMGKELRFVFRNFPLSQAHPHATHAAIAAEVVASKGEKAFWAMHDTLYENQNALDDEDVAGYAAAHGVTSGELDAAYAGGAFADRVRTDFRGGVRSGVNGTPTFFVNGERYDGDSSDVATFVAALRAAAKG